jgi:hypothetical protein
LIKYNNSPSGEDMYSRMAVLYMPLSVLDENCYLTLAHY